MNPKFLTLPKEPTTNPWKRGQWCYQIFQPAVDGMGQYFIVSFHITQILDVEHILVLNPWTGSNFSMHISQAMTLDEALKALEEAND